MSFDLIVKGGTLPDGRVADIGISGETIAAIEPRLDAPAGRIIDAAGDLVSPPFVDPHFHMDATLSYGLPRINASGTLLEGIALWGELKPLLTQKAVKERALAFSAGSTLAILPPWIPISMFWRPSGRLAPRMMRSSIVVSVQRSPLR